MCLGVRMGDKGDSDGDGDIFLALFDRQCVSIAIELGESCLDIAQANAWATG